MAKGVAVDSVGGRAATLAATQGKGVATNTPTVTSGETNNSSDGHAVVCSNLDYCRSFCWCSCNRGHQWKLLLHMLLWRMA